MINAYFSEKKIGNRLCCIFAVHRKICSDLTAPTPRIHAHKQAHIQAHTIRGFCATGKAGCLRINMCHYVQLGAAAIELQNLKQTSICNNPDESH